MADSHPLAYLLVDPIRYHRVFDIRYGEIETKDTKDIGVVSLTMCGLWRGSGIR